MDETTKKRMSATQSTVDYMFGKDSSDGDADQRTKENSQARLVVDLESNSHERTAKELLSASNDPSVDDGSDHSSPGDHQEQHPHPRRDSATTVSTTTTFPPPPELTIQRRVASTPGAFSVTPGAFSGIPEPHHQSSIVACGSQGADSSCLDPEIGHCSSAASEGVLLVNAELIVPPSEAAAASCRQQADCDVPIPCLVEASPAPQSDNLYTLVKKSRRARCGLGCCAVLFIGLIAALCVELIWDIDIGGSDDFLSFNNNSHYDSGSKPIGYVTSRDEGDDEITYEEEEEEPTNEEEDQGEPKHVEDYDDLTYEEEHDDLKYEEEHDDLKYEEEHDDHSSTYKKDDDEPISDDD
jgi:hypothetical protein